MNNVGDIVDIFRALSCKTRLDIVIGLIGNSDCNVSKMAEKLRIPQPNVSQHLTVLKNAGVIQGYRKGTQICYKLVSKQVENIITSLEFGDN